MGWESLALGMALASLGCGAGRTEGSNVAAPQHTVVAAPVSAQHARLNHLLPGLSRPALDGRVVTAGMPAGRITVIKFFAKYCAPCRRTLPATEQLHREHPEVLFIGIDVDALAADAVAMVDAFSLTFPVVHDRGLSLAEAFQVHRLPTTFIADAAGVVRWVGVEGGTEAELTTALLWVKQGARAAKVVNKVR